MRAEIPPIYSDISQDMKKDLLINGESVLQAVKNILRVRKRERVFRPEFGNELDTFLFDFVHDSTAKQIYVEYISKISRHDPRVSIDRRKSYVLPNAMQHKYDASIMLNILGLTDVQFTFIEEHKVQK